MLVTYYTRYITHHITPWCEELYRLTGGNFRLVETEPFPAFRLEQGFEDWGKILPYCVNIHMDEHGEQEACRLAIESDVAIFGGGSYRFQDLRCRDKNKLSLKLKERLYKEGLDKMTDPQFQAQMYKKHGQYKDRNLYYLCAGTYTAHDVHFQGYETRRLLQWGYFPPFTAHDPEEFICEKKDCYHMLWIGNMEINKLPWIILPLLMNIRQKGYALHLTYIGDGEYRNMLESNIREFSLENDVSFIPYMPWQEVRKEMRAADICLCTSNYAEGWGAVVSEAMNEGCLMVSSYAAGASGCLIRHGQNGFLFDHDKPEQLQSVLEYIMDHYEGLAHVRRNAYATIANEWNGKVAGQRLFHTLEYLLRGGQGALYNSGICAEAPLIRDSQEYRRYVNNSEKE